jgi:8-oxo-dGTP diphosphatase
MKISHDSETPAHGQQVITACALIHHNFDGIEKIFMPKRAATKKFLPDVYELPGGHIDYGEEMISGLQREIMEEFGVTISVGEPFAAFTYLNNVKGSHSIEVVYFAAFTDPIDKIIINPDDHSGFIWISKDQISDVVTANKDVGDQEFVVLKRAFELLDGAALSLK